MPAAQPRRGLPRRPFVPSSRSGGRQLKEAAGPSAFRVPLPNTSPPPSTHKQHRPPPSPLLLLQLYPPPLTCCPPPSARPPSASTRRPGPENAPLPLRPRQQPLRPAPLRRPALAHTPLSQPPPLPLSLPLVLPLRGGGANGKPPTVIGPKRPCPRRWPRLEMLVQLMAVK